MTYFDPMYWHFYDMKDNMQRWLHSKMFRPKVHTHTDTHTFVCIYGGFLHICKEYVHVNLPVQNSRSEFNGQRSKTMCKLCIVTLEV